MRLKIFDLATGTLADPSSAFDEDVQPVLTAHMESGIRNSVADFLRAIHPGPGCIELRAFGSGQPNTSFVTLPLDNDGLEAVRTFAAHHGKLDLYHGVANRKDDSSGALTNCSDLHALYTEIDLKAGVPMSIIWRDLLAFPLAPSFIVHSGGGLHVYWLLLEPIDLTTDLGVARAYQWLGDLAHKLHGEPESTEPARVLRLPDTENHKPAYGTPRPLVSILVANSALRYSITEIIDLLGDVDPSQSAQPIDSSRAPLTHDLDVQTRIDLARSWMKSRPPAISGQRGNKHTYDLACAVARGHDLNEQDALVAMRDWNTTCVPPWNDDDLLQVVRNAVRYAKGPTGAKLWVKEKHGKLIANHQRNVRVAFSELGVRLRLNEFTMKVELERNGRIWFLDDAVRDELWLAIDERFQMRLSEDFFTKMLRHVARESSYHPVRDYLDSLLWDGHHRIDRWLIDHAGAPESEYTQAVSRLFLVAAVRRVRRPGCKYDELLTLLSDQGRQKSTGLRTLCPQPEWFSDDLPLNVDSKEMIERTTGKWIIEASDLQGYGKREVEHLKAMLSRQTDGPVRMAYAREPIERDRHFVLAGTTNTVHFLKDKTGNRRMWPIAIRQFDIASLLKVRDQLWAEAAAAETTGESIRLDPRLWAEASERQQAHAIEDEWLIILREKLGFDDGTPKDRVLLEEPWTLLMIEAKHRDDRAAERMSAVMQALGYIRRRSRGPIGSKLLFDQKVAHRWVLEP